jgi:hypothetical protein
VAATPIRASLQRNERLEECRRLAGVGWQSAAQETLAAAEELHGLLLTMHTSLLENPLQADAPTAGPKVGVLLDRGGGDLDAAMRQAGIVVEVT